MPLVLKNNAPRVHQLGLPSKGQKALVLLPGINPNVDEAAWEKAKEIALVQHYLKTKEIEVMDLEGAKAGEKLDINGLSVAAATKLIGDTFDRAALEDWKKAAEKRGVQSAIEKQLELLEVAGDEDGDAKESEGAKAGEKAKA
jgi:hypothetical protein